MATKILRHSLCVFVTNPDKWDKNRYCNRLINTPDLFCEEHRGVRTWKENRKLYNWHADEYKD